MQGWVGVQVVGGGAGGSGTEDHGRKPELHVCIHAWDREEAGGLIMLLRYRVVSIAVYYLQCYTTNLTLTLYLHGLQNYGS